MRSSEVVFEVVSGVDLCIGQMRGDVSDCDTVIQLCHVGRRRRPDHLVHVSVDDLGKPAPTSATGHGWTWKWLTNSMDGGVVMNKDDIYIHGEAFCDSPVIS